MSEQEDWIAICAALLAICAAIERKYIGTPKKRAYVTEPVLMER
jgi:hypothetical protein